MSFGDDYFELPWYIHVVIVLIGILVGGIGGFAGIGGAPFMVALLKLCVGFDQFKAQGTVLAVMLPPMSAMGVWVMRDRAKVIWKYSVPPFLTYMGFSYLGAAFAYVFDSEILSIFFGSFLILLAAKYAYQYIKLIYGKEDFESTHSEITQKSTDPAADKDADKDTDKDEDKDGDKDDDKDVDLDINELGDMPDDMQTKIQSQMNEDGPTVAEGSLIKFNYLNITLIGAVVGVVGGLFGIGAGVLMVPVFTDFCGLHKNDARTLSLMILLPPVSAGAVIKYAEDGDVDFVMAAVLFVLYFGSNYFGAKWGKKISTTKFKIYLGMTLGILGVVIIIFALIEGY